uniref:Uncharacterized protein n=1 Tax=Sphaerodactylus townsendi TaxID=933632 RepID=A0ACB8ENS2_9SAUR
MPCLDQRERPSFRCRWTSCAAGAVDGQGGSCPWRNAMGEPPCGHLTRDEDGGTVLLRRLASQRGLRGGRRTELQK